MQNFKKTLKQSIAIRLLSGIATMILLYGGSRSGKTFILVRAIVLRAIKAEGSRHLIVRYRFNHCKQSIWYDTLPKVMKTCFPEVKYTQNKSDWFIEFVNGSQIWIGGLDDKERTEKILGNEYATIYFNECSQLTYDAVTTCMTRLAQKTSLVNRAYFDENPHNKRHWSYLLFIKGINPETREPVNKDNYASMLMNPADNVENLPEKYIDTVLGELPERKKKRFIHGQFSDDNEKALWKRNMIDDNRISADKLPSLQRVCVAIDPAVTSEETSDDTGIMSAAMGPAPKIDNVRYPELDHFYVLSDKTMNGTPLEWGSCAIHEYKTYKADRIVAEVNNGGDLVEMNIHNIDSNVSYEAVHATRGKIVRAEPVSALYEQGRVHHVGSFRELEDEMCEHEFKTSEPSPNRIDALVWGISFLAGFSQDFTEQLYNRFGMTA
jgi:phage terminase large subunit-like protein